MQFFYSNNIDNDFIILKGEEMIHCTKSLRKKVGDLMVILLTQVEGRAIGLIGRGIAQARGRSLGRN